MQNAGQTAGMVAGARDRRAMETGLLFTDTWRDTDAGLDPSSRGAEPSWQAAEHSPSCEARGVSAVIRTELREGALAGVRPACRADG